MAGSTPLAPIIKINDLERHPPSAELSGQQMGNHEDSGFSSKPTLSLNDFDEQLLRRVYAPLRSILNDQLSVQRIRNTAAEMGLDPSGIPATSEARTGMGSRAEVMPAIDRLFGNASTDQKRSAVRVLARKLSEEEGTETAERTAELLAEHGFVFTEGGDIHLLDESKKPSVYDDLLPIYARRVFNLDVEKKLEAARESGEPLGLVVLDLDRFKDVNDRHGHQVGDEVLVGVAEQLNRVFRGKGSAYRYGGEEIAVLLPNHTVDEATVVAERVRRELEQATLSSKQLKITGSLGVACFPEHGTDAGALFKAADDAVYEAKKLGRNLVRVSGEPAPEAKPPSNGKTPSISPARVDRRQPDLLDLSDEQLESIRRAYFTSGFASCPKDGAHLRIEESMVLGNNTPDLWISCPLCGFHKNLEGTPA